VHLNRFARFLYWHMNYHVEHHMYAAVPFYNLSRLRQTIRSDLPDAYDGLWPAWRDIRRFLRHQRDDPTYMFTPPLPETARPAPAPQPAG